MYEKYKKDITKNSFENVSKTIEMIQIGLMEKNKHSNLRYL